MLRDRVIIEAHGTPGSEAFDFNFQAFTSFALSNSIVAPAEASFELGDATGWQRLSQLVDLGAQFRVFVNDRLRLTGRVEQLNSALNASQSATQCFVVRTKLSDAAFSSAPQNISLRNVTVRELLIALYERIGISESDFDFRGDVSRDVMTGRITKGPDASSGRRGVDGRLVADAKPGFERIAESEQDAKVQPPETVYAAADRHLRRHGLMHWDGPDGKIVVSTPNDQQDPIAVLRCQAGEASRANNILSIDRVRDVSQAPTAFAIFGSGGQAGFSRAKVSAMLFNEDLIARGFTRVAIVIDEAMRNQALADRRAAREFAARNRGLERLTVTVDGLGFVDGADRVPWAPDTTCDVVVDLLGGALGVYYVEDVQMQRNADNGDATRLMLVQRGVWTL